MYAEKTGKWVVPKKDSPEYDEIMKLKNAGEVSAPEMPVKKARSVKAALPPPAAAAPLTRTGVPAADPPMPKRVRKAKEVSVVEAVTPAAVEEKPKQRRRRAPTLAAVNSGEAVTVKFD